MPGVAPLIREPAERFPATVEALRPFADHSPTHAATWKSAHRAIGERGADVVASRGDSGSDGVLVSLAYSANARLRPSTSNGPKSEEAVYGRRVLHAHRSRTDTTKNVTKELGISPTADVHSGRDAVFPARLAQDSGAAKHAERDTAKPSTDGKAFEQSETVKDNPICSEVVSGYRQVQFRRTFRTKYDGKCESEQFSGNDSSEEEEFQK